MKTDEQVLDEIARAAEGLLFVSEADYPLEPLRLEGAPDEARLRELAGAGADAPVATQSVEEFFRAATSEPSWKGGEELAAARRFQSVARLLRENLSDVRVYKVGEINMPAYVIGRGPGGGWLGLSTRVVET